MSAKKIEIWVDRENQIIRQSIEGDLDEQDAIYITNETEKKIQELDDKNKINILCNETRFGKPDAGARAILFKNLARPNVNKVAVVSTSPVHKAIINLVRLGTQIKKLKIIATESEALSWLLHD